MREIVSTIARLWLFGMLLSACERITDAGTNDRSQRYTLAGHGKPAVVFEAGAGNSRLTWSSVYLAIATDTTVFAYDRPGMHQGVRTGVQYASASDELRTAEEAVEDLRGLLEDARVAPPYVLVGHSLGGQYALMFAKLYPGEIAGMILVDSWPPNFAAVCREVVSEPVGECIPSDEQIEAWPLPIRAEMLGMLDSERRLPSAHELPDIPVTIITATEPSDSESSRSMQDAWMNEQRRFAEAASNIRYLEATGASHFVHRERPELVIGEIRAVLDAARDGQATGRYRPSVSNTGSGTMARHNNQMQRTCQNVTSLACARAAPFRHAADLGR